MFEQTKNSVFNSLEFRILFICGLTLYFVTTLAVMVMRRLAERQPMG